MENKITKLILNPSLFGDFEVNIYVSELNATHTMYCSIESEESMFSSLVPEFVKDYLGSKDEGAIAVVLNTIKIPSNVDLRNITNLMHNITNSWKFISYDSKPEFRTRCIPFELFYQLSYNENDYSYDPFEANEVDLSTLYMHKCAEIFILKELGFIDINNIMQYQSSIIFMKPSSCEEFARFNLYNFMRNFNMGGSAVYKKYFSKENKDVKKDIPESTIREFENKIESLAWPTFQCFRTDVGKYE